MSLLLDALKNAALEKQRKDKEAAFRDGDVTPEAQEQPPALKQKESNDAATASHAEPEHPPAAESDDTDEASSGYLERSYQPEEDEHEEEIEILVDIDFDETGDMPHQELPGEPIKPEHSQPTEENELRNNTGEEFIDLLAEPAQNDQAEEQHQEELSHPETPEESDKKEPPEDLVKPDSEPPHAEDVSAESAPGAPPADVPPPDLPSRDDNEKNKPSNPAIHFQAILERNKNNNKKRVRRYVIVYLTLIVIAIILLAGYYFLIVGSAKQNFTIGNTTGVGNYPAGEYINDANNAPPMDDSGIVSEGTALSEDSGAASTAGTTPSAPVTDATPSNPQSKAPAPAKAAKQAPVVKAKPAAKKQVASQRQPITILKGAPKKDLMSATIDEAYEAYTSGEYELAERKYRDALAIDPLNRDAILGSAAIHMTQQKYREALNLYQRQLTRDPQDEYAHAGILSIASAEVSSPELLSRVNDLLKTYPNAGHLHFLKGRLLSQRFRWAAAQVSFFNAWSQQPERADYAYNLAISLDHINQRAEALKFYQRARHANTSTLSQADIAAISKRIAQLEAQP